jgi:uncharacterized membrane protein YphA (DoxX/SURF4 family)
LALPCGISIFIRTFNSGDSSVRLLGARAACIGVLCALIVTLVHVVALWNAAGGFYRLLPALEMSILLLSLLFIGPGKYSVDKS